MVRPEFKPKTTNPDASGAVIRWSVAGKTYSRIKNAGGGFLSSSDPRQILGVGKQQIDWLEVQWPAPSHVVDRIEKPAMNRYLLVVEGEHPAVTPIKSSRLLFPSVKLLEVSAQQTAGPVALWPQAKSAMERGDFAQARQILLQAVKADPKDAALWFHLGASCSELNDDEEAIAAFERARALAPRRPDTYFDLGLLYWRAGDLGKAKEAYRSGLALDPADSTALQNYSLLLTKTGQYQDAIAPLLRLKQDAKFSIPARVGLIECYLKTAQPSKADAESDELIRSGAAGPADQTKLAAILIENNALPIAEKVLRNSLHLDPNQARAEDALGTVYMMQKRYDDASPHFERAVELDPNSSEYALAFARTLVLRKREQVLLAFTKSVEPKFGSLPEFQYILGLAYFGVTQFQDAANVLEKLLLNHPSNPDRVYFILGKSYLGLGKYDLAEKALRQAIQLNPKASFYYEDYATVMRQEGGDKLDEALAQLKWASQYDPQDPQISLQLALCYESKQDFANAAALLEQTVEREPDLAPAHVALARVYYRLGKKSDAQREKETVKALQDKLDQQKMKSKPAPQEPPVQQP